MKEHRFGRFLAKRIDKLRALTPSWILKRKARKLAFTRPLEWYPGWKFSEGWDNTQPEYSKRRALWEIFNERREENSISIHWYTPLVINVYLGNDISRCLYINGCYEPNEFVALAQILKPGMTCIDGGANDGLYTTFIAQQTGPTGKVYAFEPSKREYQRLLGNLKLNNHSWVEPIPSAIADAEGDAQLVVAGYEHEGQNTLGDFVHEGITQSHTESVHLECIDQVIARKKITALDFLKLDIEGAEMKALRGALDSIKKFHPYMLIELNDAALKCQGASSLEVTQFLDNLGYRIFSFSDATGKPVQTKVEGPFSSNVIVAHSSRTWPNF